MENEEKLPRNYLSHTERFNQFQGISRCYCWWFIFIFPGALLPVLHLLLIPLPGRFEWTMETSENKFKYLIEDTCGLVRINS